MSGLVVPLRPLQQPQQRSKLLPKVIQIRKRAQDVPRSRQNARALCRAAAADATAAAVAASTFIAAVAAAAIVRRASAECFAGCFTGKHAQPTEPAPLFLHRSALQILPLMQERARRRTTHDLRHSRLEIFYSTHQNACFKDS
jgi:hypothetical protein